VTVLWAVVIVLAAYRLCRLVVADEVTKPLREWVAARFGEDSSWAYLVECFWCTSIYLALPVVVLGVWLPDNRVVQVLLGSLATSTLVGFIGAHLEPEPE